MSPDSGCNDPVSLAGTGERGAKGAAEHLGALPASFPAWARALCCRCHVGGIRLRVILASPCPALSSPALLPSQHCSRGMGEVRPVQREGGMNYQPQDVPTGLPAIRRGAGHPYSQLLSHGR